MVTDVNRDKGIVRCKQRFMLLDLGQMEVDESMSLESLRIWLPF